MSLASIKDLLPLAAENDYAVGAFSVGNLEMVYGAIRAAEALRSPLILQIAESRLATSPLSLMAPLMRGAAESARVPVAVHFDHGCSIEAIASTLEYGFTSVMYDGSRMPLEENIRNTLRVRRMADAFGAAVEAEIGQVGGTEDGKKAAALCSDPDEAVRFYEEARPDALAVAIGNAHGKYHGDPMLDFDVLAEIHRRLPGVPLVLHGGSGISADGFRKCIRLGVRKINIATASFDALSKQVHACCAEQPQADYFLLSSRMAQGTQDNVAEHIRIFQSDGKAAAEGGKLHAIHTA